MHVTTIEVPSAGNRCHLVHDGARALVVDPPRDLTAVEHAAAEAGVDIVAVADTHVHNDYVSGALGLARRHGADYLLAAEERVEFERVGVREGDVVPVGRLEVRVLSTPGHTRHHQAFVVSDDTGPGALFSGGSLLDRTVGRTDLLDPRLALPLARAQWSSVRRLAALDPATGLHPTHGFGSLCASRSVPATPGATMTIHDQLAGHPALHTEREEFARDLVAGFGPVPGHYAHMDPLNRAGAGRGTPRPARRVTAEQVTDAVLAGSWVVDLRDRAAYAAAHLPGAVNVGWSEQFATYIGWLVPWHDDIVLLSDTPDVLEPALRDLASIGIEGVGTHVLDQPAELPASYRRATWAEFREPAPAAPRVLVDVRGPDEWEAGHLPGAVHVPVHEVDREGPHLPPGELWVHCRSGYSAGIAASLLHRLGRAVVHVDDAWEHVADLAVPPTDHAA